MAHLIDRRLNDRGKNSSNRERFLRRYKTQVQDAVRRMVGERKLSDLEQGGEVRVPRKDVSEPAFNYGRVGDREHVLPGNREYVTGDRIPRPEGGGGGGGNGAKAATATARTTSCSSSRAKSSCRSSSTTSSCRAWPARSSG